MSLKAVVVAADPLISRKVRLEDYDLVDVLGEAEEAIAVQINEVIKAISEAIRESITDESELTVEITGSISLKAEGGVKWLFFNVGGGTTKSDTLKVVLKTKIKPSQNGTQKSTTNNPPPTDTQALGLPSRS
jgi:hypothetical protein